MSLPLKYKLDKKKTNRIFGLTAHCFPSALPSAQEKETQ